MEQNRRPINEKQQDKARMTSIHAPQRHAATGILNFYNVHCVTNLPDITALVRYGVPSVPET